MIAVKIDCLVLFANLVGRADRSYFIHVYVLIVWQPRDLIIDRVKLSALLVQSFHVIWEGGSTSLCHFLTLLVHEVEPVVFSLWLIFYARLKAQLTRLE